MKAMTRTGRENYLHAADFKKMILGANYFFDREKEAINSLNVFPVPDGDTGTNMSMTLKAAVEGSMNYEGESIGELSALVASSALMGARGNSGVILSQILRGMARGLRKKDHISPGELSKAFQYGVVYAYKAVSKPVEGTILTVAREMARGIRTAVNKGENLYGSIEEAITRGKLTLEKTTDMLPALKEAGVVDAGGLGLLVFFEGCLYALKRSFNDMLNHRKTGPSKLSAIISKPAAPKVEALNLQYPYCTEFILKTEAVDLKPLKAALSEQGDSLLVVSDSGIIKIHIHTGNPGFVLQQAQQNGTLHDIKIENMIDQQKHASSAAAETDNTLILNGLSQQQQGKTAIIAVSFGEGFREIFLSLGANEIVFGGQTMNPKVEDLLNAVVNLPQDSVVILPNNKNIFMVAEQVKDLAEKQVQVLETRSMPEGLSALIAFNSEKDLAANIEAMAENVKNIKTGSITNATRDTVIKGEEVKQGFYLGLAGDEVAASGTDLDHTSLKLLETIVADENDLITIFYGREISRQEAASLDYKLKEKYPGKDIELHYGGQPIYHYIFSVE